MNSEPRAVHQVSTQSLARNTCRGITTANPQTTPMIYGSFHAPNPFFFEMTDRPTDPGQRSAVCVKIPHLFLEALSLTYIRTCEMRGEN